MINEDVGVCIGAARIELGDDEADKAKAYIFDLEARCIEMYALLHRVHRFWYKPDSLVTKQEVLADVCRQLRTGPIQVSKD